MPGPVTVAGMVTRVRRRAGIVAHTLDIDDTEITEYVEQSLGHLMDIILSVAQADFYQDVTTSRVTSAGTDLYTLDDSTNGAYKILSVEIQWGGKWRKIRPYMLAEEVSMEDVSGWTDWRSVRYRMAMLDHIDGPIRDTESYTAIRFIPTPQATHTFRVRYIPVPYTDSETGVFQGFTGWDEWVVCDAAAKCCEKMERFELADRLLLRRDKNEERIRWAALTMDSEGQGSVRELDEEARWADRTFAD